MTKLVFLLLVISLLVFTACSDDSNRIPVADDSPKPSAGNIGLHIGPNNESENSSLDSTCSLDAIEPSCEI